MSRKLTTDIYEKTKSDNYYLYQDLIRQIRKSCVSIFSNIAEGSARVNSIDRKRFISIAYSSAVETMSQLIICNDLQIIGNDDYKEIRRKIEELILKINAFHKSIK